MTKKARQHLDVDPIACSGHGVCAELFPDWVRLDDWGYPIIKAEVIPDEAIGDARWAVSNCPTLALKLRRAGVEAQRAQAQSPGRVSPRRDRRSTGPPRLTHGYPTS